MRASPATRMLSSRGENRKRAQSLSSAFAGGRLWICQNDFFGRPPEFRGAYIPTLSARKTLDTTKRSPTFRIVRAACAFAFVFVLAVAADVAEAQSAESARTEALRVFLDCNNCDFDYLRREIPFVNYVRDRKDAELHILVTTQSTGSGGTEYTFKFIGLDRFEGIDDELRYTAAQTLTGDERRHGYSEIIKLGLVRYVTSTAAADQLRLIYRTGKPAETAATPSDDPWNFWSFRLRGNGSVNGEASSKSRNFSASAIANRTTQAWKLNLATNMNFHTNEFTLSDGARLKDDSHDHGVSGLVVKSLGDHWALAGRGRVWSTTFLNEERAGRAAAGVEYSVFPYAESSRRELTVQFTTGVNHFQYLETTIYGKDSETVADGVLVGSLDVRQPWGSGGLSVEAATYFHDVNRHRLVLNGDIDIRLFKGFSLTLDGAISRIHDQLYLRLGDATDEEILLRRRQLATSYRYRFSIGASYTFGSIFNNVVNTRF
jgi:hypothetical protein